MAADPATAERQHPPPADTAGPVVQTRVDGPHRLATVSAEAERAAPATQPVAEDAGDGIPVLLEEMRTQAAQLAEHLQRRQALLDQREAEINGRLADFEQESREARRWFAEQQEQLETQRGDLANNRQQQQVAQQAIDERQRALDERQLALHRLVARVKERRDQFAREQAAAQRGQQRDHAANEWRRQQLESRREELQHRRLALEAAFAARREALESAVESKQQQLEAMAAELRRNEAACQRRTEEADVQQRQNQQVAAAQADAWQALEQQRQQFDQQRRAFEEQQREARTIQEQRCAELEQQRSESHRQHERLEAWEAELLRFRDELRQAQADTLQMRLAGERLLAQLSDAVPPEALARSISRLRNQLTEHYRRAAAELQDERQELDQLRAELDRHRQEANHQSPISNK